MEIVAAYTAALDQLFTELSDPDLSEEREAEILTATGSILERLEDLGGGDAA
jgi:hypothetical protein